MPRTSRLAIISMLAVLAALLPGASSASAVGINGISDENVGEWKPYSWAALENTGVKLVRKIVPWDVALNAGSLAALHSWVSTVESGTGIQVLISFNHVANTTPPPIASYSQAITQFRQEFPQIGAYTAWNEPNHFPSDPATHNSNPSKLEQAPLAAEYWIALHNQCQAAPACTVAAGDFNEAGSPTNFTDYVNAYKSRIAQSGLTPPVWAYHPYSAINDGSFNFVLNTFLPLIPADKPIWFTEAGGYVCVPGAGYVGGSYATALSHQEQAAQNYVNLVNQVGGRVHRAYYYFFSPKEAGQIACPGGSASKMDTGLLDGNGFARPAFKKVFAHAVLPPLATTNGATGVGSREGTMNGSIDPRGYHTYYYFEYGATTAYGGVVPDPNTDRYHGFNSGWGSRSATLTGLKPATTYHYRVVAESNMGTTYGADQTFKTLAEPESDVNGDHKADLVTLHTSGNIYNYMGDANGFFGNYTSSGGGGMNPAQYDGTGYYPIDVAEVNGDDYDDLVAIDQYGSVATAKGQANGYFAAWSFSLNNTITPAIINPGAGKYEPVGVADVTGDGRGDLVAYNNVEKAIYTYPGTSTGSFSTTKVASVSGADSARFDSSGEYFLDVADVTGDGKADLVSQTTNGYAKVYPATGTGGFGAAVLSFSGTLTSALATGSGWDPIALADVNGDGRADLVTHHSSGNVYTYMGNADGTFGSYTTAFGGTADSNLFDGTGQEFAAVVDVNGDGFADLITAGYGNVYTYLGQATGDFGGAKSSFGGTYVSTRFNKGAGWQMVMEKTLKKRDGCTPTGCGVQPESDVNGDHKADLVTLHTSGNIYTYMGKSDGFFGNYTSSGGGGMNPAQYDGTGYYPIDVAEVNGDDYDDLVAIDQYGSVATAKGQANGYFAAWSFSLNSTITPAINNPTPGKYEPVGVADVTGDGRGDLVAYNNVEKAIYTYPGTSTGSFSTTKVASVSGADSARFDSSGEYFLDVADVTGDGKADLVSQTTNGYAKVYPATGTGGFGAAVLSFSGTLTSALATGSGWDPIALADVNGDGFADLVTHHSSGNVYTYMGKADGTFGAYTTAFGGTADSNLFDGTGQEFAAVIDVNGDGFADLITAGYGNVYTYLGDAGGYFGGPNSSFGGTYVSTRFNKGAGYQMVMEKTLKKRDGCTPTGCK